MAVHQHAGGDGLAVFLRGDGADVTILGLGQDEHAGKALIGVELGGDLVRHVQAKAACHGQAPAQAQVGDIAHLIARKTRVLRGRNAAGGVFFQMAEHHAGQFEDRLLPPLAGDAVGLRDGQDEILHAGKGLFRHLIPALEPGAEGAAGRQGAQRQGRQGVVLRGPRAQLFPLLQQAVQCFPAQLIDSAAGHKPRSLVHLHVDILGCKGGAARLGEAPLQALGGVGAGGLGFKITVGKGFVGAVGDGQLLAALFNFQLHLDGHPAALAAVKFPQGGQGLLGQLGVGLAADAEHGAVDLAVQIARGEARAAEGVFQGVAVEGSPLPARQTGVDSGGDVLRRAEAALDFDGRHADGLQLIQLVDDGIILQREVVQAARLAFGQRVSLKGQAAGARAGAPVAAAATQKGRHIALAADAHTQRTVHETLGLDAAVSGDVFHFGQAELTGQHHPGKAQLFEFQRALQGVHAHLGGAMAGQLGGNFADQGRHGQILTDDRIGPAGGHGADGVAQARQLAAVDGGVERHMDSHAPGMAEAHRFFQGVGVKIACARAGVEARKAQIHRVRPAEHGGAEHFFAAHRGKDLNVCHNSPSGLYLLKYQTAASRLRGAFFRRLFFGFFFRGGGLCLGLQFGQLLPQGVVLPLQHLVLGPDFILGQLCLGGVGDVILDLAAHILGAARALAVLVQIVHGAENGRLAQGKVAVVVQQFGDVLIQFFGQRGDISFRIGRCDRIGCARNGHSHFVYHRISSLCALFCASFSSWAEFVAELPTHSPGRGPVSAFLPPICTLYYNINTAREKVVFLNFWKICQKVGAKNSSYGKNNCFFLQSGVEDIIMLLLCYGRKRERVSVRPDFLRNNSII